ncbi:MAG: DMT family transporter [Caulobacteraceae bacterium]
MDSDPQPENRSPHRRGALVILLLGAITIATSPILFRLSHTGPAAAGCWRLLFALPWLAPFALRGGRTGRGFSLVLVLAGVMFAGDLACWHYAIRYTSVANATVLSNLSPVLVTLGAWALWRERPSGGFVAGLAAALAGAVVMAMSRAGHGQPIAHTGLGNALGAATAGWYGLYFLAVRKARARHTTAEVMIWSSLVGAPILMGLALALREPLVPPGLSGWAALAGLGLAQAAGQGAIAWALGRLSAATAAVVVLIQPIAAALFAWTVLGEDITWLQSLGGAMAIGGVAFAVSRRSKPAGRLPLNERQTEQGLTGVVVNLDS